MECGVRHSTKMNNLSFSSHEFILKNRPNKSELNIYYEYPQSEEDIIILFDVKLAKIPCLLAINRWALSTPYPLTDLSHCVSRDISIFNYKQTKHQFVLIVNPWMQRPH